MHRERYRRLHDLLTSGRVEIRVVPKDRVFIHGKAGVIEAADGTKSCFLGFEQRNQEHFAENYEILWENTSPDGAAWVEDESMGCGGTPTRCRRRSSKKSGMPRNVLRSVSRKSAR